MDERDEMTLAEMIEDLAREMYERTDHTMGYCRDQIDLMTDGEIFAAWQQMETARA